MFRVFVGWIVIGLAATTLHAQPNATEKEAAAKPEEDAAVRRNPTALLAEIGSSRLQHGRRVNRLLFSRDGKHLYSASDDFTVRQWDAATGEERRSFASDTGRVRDIALTSDGAILLMATDDSGVLVWDVKTARQVGRFAEGAVQALALAGDGATVFFAQEDGVHCWDLQMRKEFPKLESADVPVSRLCISRDEKLLAGLSCASVLLWNVADGRLRQTFQVEGEQQKLTTMALAPDGGTVAAADGKANVLLWDVESEERKHLVPPPITDGEGQWLSMAFSPDGEVLYTGGVSGRLRALVRRDVKQRFLVQAQYGPATCVAVSPDGKFVATGGGRDIEQWDQQRWDHSIHLFRTEQGEELPQSRRPTVDLPSILTVSGDGKRVVKGCFNKRFTIWDVEKNVLLKEHHKPVFLRVAIALSPDGEMIASAARSRLQLSDADGDTTIAELQGLSGAASGMKFTPDGTRLAVATTSGELSIWEVGERKRLLHKIPHAHEKEIWKVDISPDGQYVATAGFDGGVGVWSMATGEQRFRHKAHDSLVRTVKFSADGMQLVSVCNGGYAKVWETATGKLVRSIDTGWSLSSAAFCQRDRILILGHHYDRLELWDIATGRMLQQLRPRPGPYTTDMLVHPEGKWLWTAHSDSVVRKWDLPALLANVPPLPSVELPASDLEEQWRLLAEENPLVANRAIWKLAAGGDAATEMLWEKLGPKPGAEEPPISKEEVQQLLADLDDDSFRTREAATRRLKELAPTVLPDLKAEQARTRSVEVRVRLKEIIQSARDFSSLEKLSREDLRVARAVQILTYRNTPRSRELLAQLGKGDPQKLPPRQARAALARLKQLRE